ncbi:unnamed protein product [Schistocephalus solidus]|uniref:Uncharacterized protein n=1 Tax=Schistocephalus solidus TaxID=70667 RepID=A0A3P7F6K1_SCHSO|nr:unnamed protein product [Schistocephalus solidus]
MLLSPTATTATYACALYHLSSRAPTLDGDNECLAVHLPPSPWILPGQLFLHVDVWPTGTQCYPVPGGHGGSGGAAELQSRGQFLSAGKALPLPAGAAGLLRQPIQFTTVRWSARTVHSHGLHKLLHHKPARGHNNTAELHLRTRLRCSSASATG